MPKPTPDLRTNNIPLEVHRCTNIQGLQEQAQKHWGLRRIQPFFPSIEKLFKLDNVRMPYHYGIQTQNSIQTIVGESSIYSGGKEVKIHLKKTMLYPSYRVMRGEFAATGLPNKEDIVDTPLPHQSAHNAAYVGSLACLVLSESGCQHFPKVFGVFSGIEERHTIDISDDYEDLCDRPWFSSNIGHFFDLRLRKSSEAPVLELQETTEVIDLGIEDIDAPDVPPSTAIPPSEDYDADNEQLEEEEDEDGESSCSTDYIFEIHSCSSRSSDEDDEDDDEDNGGGFTEEAENPEPFAHAIFKDCPVQVTVMEACAGTLYQLFRENPETPKRCAWIGQIIFALAFAQRTFGLCHNDLHVMNVMYVPTETEYFYYNAGGKMYRLPTFGKLIKIIDFDRATYSVKLPKMRESKFFMSDQFQQDEEAGGQYNVEPFYNSKYSEIKPNPSFDLVRLATSMFWDCFPNGPCEEYENNPIFKMFMTWLILPDGQSILFRDPHAGDFSERYRGFHLYKAIAKYCRDTAVPRKQIDKFGSVYLYTEKVPQGESVLFIEP